MWGRRSSRALFTLAERHAPVDAVSAAIHGLLQLPEQRGDARRIVRQSGSTRELRRIYSAGARQELAEHLPELLLGVPVTRLVVPIGHVSHLQSLPSNRTAGVRAPVWEMA
jgi:hypothetical protein